MLNNINGSASDLDPIMGMILPIAMMAALADTLDAPDEEHVETASFGEIKPKVHTESLTDNPLVMHLAETVVVVYEIGSDEAKSVIPFHDNIARSLSMCGDYHAEEIVHLLANDRCEVDAVVTYQLVPQAQALMDVIATGDDALTTIKQVKALRTVFNTGLRDAVTARKLFLGAEVI